MTQDFAQLFKDSSPRDQGEIVRQLCRKDFASFFKMAFRIINPGTPLVWNWHLDYFCYLAARMLPIDDKGLNPAPHLPRLRRLIINVPPRCSKSELFTVALSAFIMGHYPHERQIAASVTDDLAGKLAAKVTQIVKSPFFQELFPGFALQRDSVGQLVVADHLGERTITSSKGTIIGQGGNFIYMDDMQTVQHGQQESGLDIEKVNHLVTSVILGRVNDPMKAAFLCVMQRIGPNDLTNHLLSYNKYLPEEMKWVQVVLPEICAETKEYEFYGRKFLWEKGEPLDKNRRPMPVIEEKRSLTPPWDWATQYLQNPVPLTGGVIPMSDFRRFDLQEVLDGAKGDPIFRFQSWDTGNKDSKDSCPSVCGTWDVYEDGIHLIDVKRGKWQFPDLCREVVGSFVRWKPTVKIIEDKASGTQLIQHFRDPETAKRLRLEQGLPSPPPIFAFDPKPFGDKYLRMQRKTVLITQGRVWLPHSAPWLSDFEQECLFFPKGMKDQVDQMSQVLTYWTECSAERYWIALL